MPLEHAWMPCFGFCLHSIAHQITCIMHACSCSACGVAGTDASCASPLLCKQQLNTLLPIATHLQGKELSHSADSGLFNCSIQLSALLGQQVTAQADADLFGMPCCAGGMLHLLTTHCNLLAVWKSSECLLTLGTLTISTLLAQVTAPAAAADPASRPCRRAEETDPARQPAA